MIDNDTILESLSASERYEYDIKKSVELFKLAALSDENDGALANIKAMMGAGTGSALMPDGNPLGLHFVMFMPTLMGQVGDYSTFIGTTRQKQTEEADDLAVQVHQLN